MMRRMGQTGVARRSWWSALLLLLALATLLAGCAAPSLPPLPWQTRTTGPTPLPDAQQTLHISAPYLNANALQLDPIHEFNDATIRPLIYSLVYSSLFTFDSALRPVPALADHYTVSADGLRYTVHLRSGARFSDGAPITSADAAFSLDRAAGPCDSYVSFTFFTFKDESSYVNQQCQVNQHAPPTITAATPGRPVVPTLLGDALLTPDPSTLVIVLAQPDGALLAKLAEPSSGIVERAVVMRYGGDWPLHLTDGGGQGTSGMYVPSALVPDGANSLRVTLERVATYWGARPRVREIAIELRGSNEPETGDVLFAGPEGYHQKQIGGSPVWSRTPNRIEDYLALDPTAPGLSDMRVRQALALALDKTALALSLDGQATNHIVPPGAGAYPAQLSDPIATAPLTGDIARAQALWQSYVRDRCGGVVSRCPAIAVYDTGWLARPGVGPLAVSSRWMRVLPGLRVNLTEPPDVLLPPNPKETALPLTWYEDYPDPQDWLTDFVRIPGDTFPAPFPQYAPADALVARAEATLDPAARLALYQQAENILLNDAIIIPIAQRLVAWRVTARVVNFPANPAPFIPPSAWARIYLTAPESK